MPINIAEIVSNVIVTFGSGADAPTTSGQSGGTDGGSGAQSESVDPKIVADRVYRLIREDLERGWERE
jgi:hypothetical protein